MAEGKVGVSNFEEGKSACRCTRIHPMSTRCSSIFYSTLVTLMWTYCGHNLNALQQKIADIFTFHLGLVGSIRWRPRDPCIILQPVRIKTTLYLVPLISRNAEEAGNRAAYFRTLTSRENSLEEMCCRRCDNSPPFIHTGSTRISRRAFFVNNLHSSTCLCTPCDIICGNVI